MDRRTGAQQTHLRASILFIENSVCYRLTQSRQIALGVKQILNTPWLTYRDYYANVLRATQSAIHATQVQGPQWRIHTSPYLERIRNNATVGQLKIQANSLTNLYKKKFSSRLHLIFFSSRIRFLGLLRTFWMEDHLVTSPLPS
jgi:hypothetical protein